MSINEDIAKWAKWVSERIKVPWEIIYSQWAMEQPEAIENPAKFAFNLAGLTKSGTPGIWRSYSNLEGFANDYTYGFLLPGYPKTYGTSTVQDFVRGLKNGLWGSYYGQESVESYAGKVQGKYNSIFGGADPTPAGTITDPLIKGGELTTWDQGIFDRAKSWARDKLGLFNQPGDVPIKEEISSRKSVGLPTADLEKTYANSPAGQKESGEGWDRVKAWLTNFPSLFVGVVLVAVGLVVLTRQTVINTVKEGVS